MEFHQQKANHKLYFNSDTSKQVWEMHLSEIYLQKIDELLAIIDDDAIQEVIRSWAWVNQWQNLQQN